MPISFIIGTKEVALADPRGGTSCHGMQHTNVTGMQGMLLEDFAQKFGIFWFCLHRKNSAHLYVGWGAPPRTFTTRTACTTQLSRGIMSHNPPRIEAFDKAADIVAFIGTNVQHRG